MRITRGAPFRLGNVVEITNGPHKGKVGEVKSICNGRLCVGVILELEAGTTTEETFGWDEIRKLQAKRSV